MAPSYGSGKDYMYKIFSIGSCTSSNIFISNLNIYDAQAWRADV